MKFPLRFRKGVTNTWGLMPTFKTVAEAAKYLKKHGIGAKCMLTGGAVRCVHPQFSLKGLTVSCKGKVGARTVVLTKFTTKSKDTRVEWVGKPVLEPKYAAVEVVPTLSVGVRTYMQGNRNSMVSLLRKNFPGTGGYSIIQVKEEDDKRGDGWFVTLLK